MSDLWKLVAELTEIKPHSQSLQDFERSGQSKGERGGTAFSRLLFLASVVPPPGFKC